MWRTQSPCPGKEAWKDLQFSPSGWERPQTAAAFDFYSHIEPHIAVT